MSFHQNRIFWIKIQLLSQCEEAQGIFEKGQVLKFCIESVFKLLDMEMHVFEINIASASSQCLNISQKCLI